MISYIDKREADRRYTLKIQAKQVELKKAPFWKKGKIKTEIQALEEGQRDILTPSVTQAQTTQSVVDKNNYSSYTKQVETTYEMYNNRTDYGGELLGALIDTRQVLIAGEGLSVVVDGTAKAKKWVQDFLDYNRLHGTNLMEMVQIGEMEGRNLLLLWPDKEDNNIKARSQSWKIKPYTVQYDPRDISRMKRVVVTNKLTSQEEPISNSKDSVVVRLGGSIDRMHETTNRIHKILTHVENFSRAYYDLRKNGHLFGRITPYFKTENRQQAVSINNAINAGNFEIGETYAGPADFSFIAPPADGLDVLIKDMLSSLKIIATMTGIPIHWLNWPELMSNRATAENIHESLILATKKERLIWEESFEELIQKAQIMAVDKLGQSNNIIADVEVNLPIISISQVKEISEIWTNFWQLGLMSKYSVQNKIPGIDPMEENKRIDQEREENAKLSPFNNETVNNELGDTEDEDD